MARRLDITAVLALAGAALIVGVTGCTAAPSPVASAPPSTRAPRPRRRLDDGAGSTEGDAPTLRPDLPASENLPFFDAVNLGVVAANASAGGRDFIDALVAAGFDKSQMEVTADRTTVDLQADSVQFAVLFERRVPRRPVRPGFRRLPQRRAARLGTGGCLVGETRPIDW